MRLLSFVNDPCGVGCVCVCAASVSESAVGVCSNATGFNPAALIPGLLGAGA